MVSLEEIINKYRKTFGNVLPLNLSPENVYELDLSVDNQYLRSLNKLSTESLGQYIQAQLKKVNKNIAIGGYAENRLVYQMSEHFGRGAEARSVHLGIDIWYKSGTPVFAPLDGIIHSFNNNANFGDYGPTIILEHRLENVTFYTLYGHLSTSSIEDIANGDKIKKGDIIAHLGEEHENGNWPPHLHFQLITDMLDKEGDFPGVCSVLEKDKWLNICPDPRLILAV
ncbi:peptidoglycan DD-metalloendopeptidase family protein [Carboxylicivirga caseinilyticus]|uniref:peptidoglycan DD-metalloendopeptidase family protein n=1 Tax=Carboxylicivirga caseinilyticus TaxID=3417572 RepID=UPI003D3418B2|nr:peptidoglycan DD-metalloendopeptidase family protein [Marinilabiliaceae bacterium A049]